MFAKDRAQTPIGALSGGEKNRAVLARLFTQPANVLVLDEPTNDLDMETLELLEEQIMNFPGTVLLVSHDRDFMDHTVTGLLVVESDGRVTEHAGGYTDWENRGFKLQALGDAAKLLPKAVSAEITATAPPASSGVTPKKLSYKEQRELDALPQEIESLEMQIAAMETEMIDPSFYSQEHSVIQSHAKTLAELQLELETKMERWLELDHH